jgi:tetratricopeptide (TPR) repeat protein
MQTKTYFIIGYVLLLAMALCWSIDNSIVFILFGSSIYFFFLGFYSRARHTKTDKRKKADDFVGDSFALPFADLLVKVFSKATVGGTDVGNDAKRRNAAASRRFLAPLLVFAIFGTFFIVVVRNLFSLSGDDFQSVDYLNLANEEYWRGEYDSAYLNYRRAWKADETNTEAMVGYGNVLAYKKQIDSAIVMYDKAFIVDPGYLAAQYAKGALYYNLERFKECIEVIAPLLQTNSDYYDGMLLIGDCYYALGQFDDAIGWYANAYDNGQSRSASLCHIMAFIYDTRGEYDKAINLYKEALMYDSTIVDIYKRLGQLLTTDDGNYYRTKAIVLENHN